MQALSWSRGVTRRSSSWHRFAPVRNRPNESAWGIRPIVSGVHYPSLYIIHWHSGAPIFHLLFRVLQSNNGFPLFSFTVLCILHIYFSKFLREFVTCWARKSLPCFVLSSSISVRKWSLQYLHGYNSVRDCIKFCAAVCCSGLGFSG